ncbi:MAG: WGxxGxxG-CTERM domain-containing protein [Candidatus Protochlamydia sp.]|nr:WGxxGxxG-CTERM domain-containing protein [Candidatus Protochlamydia sp.]
MKFLNLTGFLRISILALVCMLSAGSVNAQTTTRTTPTTTTDRDYNSGRTTTTTERDHDTDWGWIGLLGLLGLAGLIPRKRTVDHDRVDTTNRNTLNR